MAIISDAQYKLAKDQDRNKSVKMDKKKIEDALISDSEATLHSAHMYIDGKYGAYVPDWGKGMYGYDAASGFYYPSLDKDSLMHNLTLMQARLEGYAAGFEKPNQNTYAPSNSVNVNVTNTNEVNITISFEETRQKIEDMTALSREQTDEILEKINELEEISKENSSRKTKWEKVKPIIAFALDKGADVAIAILSLVMQMKLGM